MAVWGWHLLGSVVCEMPGGSHSNVPILHTPCYKMDPLIGYSIRWDPVSIKHYISPCMVTLAVALQVEETNQDSEQ